MKCFIHFDKEAVAACRNCGKGMCANCSAFSGHRGICPECRKEELEKEVSKLISDKKEQQMYIVNWAILALLVITIPVSAIAIAIKAKKIKEIDEAINSSYKTINRLNQALKRGSASI